MRFSKISRVAAAAGLLLLTSFGSQAQGFYGKLGGGYNFGIGSAIEYQGTGSTSYPGNSSAIIATKFDRMYIKHGKGGAFGASFGYMFNNNIGLELGVNYLACAKSSFKIEAVTINGIGSFGGINAPLNFVSLPATTETYTTKSQMVLVQPSLVMTAGLPKFNPYTRVGLVIAHGSLKNSYSYSYSYSNSNVNSGGTEDKYFGGLGFGLQAALGLNFRLNDNIAIYTEGTFCNLTYSPEKGEVTKFNRNGTDLLHTLTISQKEIIFEDERTISSNGPQASSDSPSSGDKQRFTLNSLGLQAGIKFSF